MAYEVGIVFAIARIVPSLQSQCKS